MTSAISPSSTISPPSVSSSDQHHPHHQAPRPSRNKSTTSLNSSTTKPKRNKSSTSLHTAGGHHGAHHHHVQMPHHGQRKNSHGASAAGRPRLGSASSAGSSAARKGSFGGGLGMMTSLTAMTQQSQQVDQGDHATAPGSTSDVAPRIERPSPEDEGPNEGPLHREPQAEAEEEEEERVSPRDAISVEPEERGRSRSRSMDRRAKSSERSATAQGRDRTLPPGPGGRGERSEGSPKRKIGEGPALEVPSEGLGLVDVKEAKTTSRKGAKFEFPEEEDDDEDDDEEEERQGRSYHVESRNKAHSPARPTTPPPPSQASTLDQRTVEHRSTIASPSSTKSPDSTTSTVSHSRPPMRNKSSSGLSTHTVRPKRNKSSSSLHHAHHGPGHHGVQFNSSSSAMAKKRSGSSSGRKPAFGFGMTTMQNVGRRESDESTGSNTKKRPDLDRRGSSTSTLVNDDENRSGRSRSREGDQDEGEVVVHAPVDHDVTPMATPPQQHRKSNKARLAPRDEVVGSVHSSASDWESATDSPFAIAKALPTDGGSRGHKPEAVSGLAQVMGEGDRVAGTTGELAEDEEAEVGDGRKESRTIDRAPASPRRTTVSVPPPQPPSKSAALAPAPSAAQNSIAFPTTSENPSPPRVYSRPQGANARKSSNASIMSNASARSLALSFAGRMGPPAPMFRRAASTVAPVVVDRGNVGAEFAGTDAPASSYDDRRRVSESGYNPRTSTSSRQGGSGNGVSAAGATQSHRRNDSLNSVRSLRGAIESATMTQQPNVRRAATSDGRDTPRRSNGPRMSTDSNSSALAALGNIASRPSTTPDAGGAFRRSASGYFSQALRGLTGLPGLTPPLSPSASSRGQVGTGPMSGYGASTSQPQNASARARPRSSPSSSYFIQPVVSKFVETPPPVTSTFLSQSPTKLGGVGSLAAAKRSQSSASLSGMGAMSRTQQKAFLARDAPYYASGGGPPNASSNGNGQDNVADGTKGAYWSLPPASPSHPPTSRPTAATTAAANDDMQNWARRFIAEAERIERQYRAVEKWRDPLGESLERVWANRIAAAAATAAATSSTNNVSSSALMPLDARSKPRKGMTT